MTDSNPDSLNGKPLPWYRGLSGYHWWVLIIASMGWMFDTMDQQFFNLGRGPAMQDVLKFDPVVPGLERLEGVPGSTFTAAEVSGMVEKGLLTAEQAQRAMTDSNGQPRESITRRGLAAVIGYDLLTPTFVEMGSARLKEVSVEADVYDKQTMDQLVSKGGLSDEAAAKLLDQHGGAIPKATLARYLGQELAKTRADQAGDHSTMIFVLGWAIGGLFFGWVGDSLGRAKTMAVTILTYSLFTGLNGLVHDEFWFNVFRFMTALGVGGEFAAGAALVAESMPDRARPAALGALQALSAVGNMLAAVLAALILPVLGWRWLFFVGALPGLIAVFVFLKLKEPEKWREARAKWLAEKAAGITRKHSSYAGLLADARWRKRAIIGLLLGVVGVGGLWGVGFFTPELNRLIGKMYSPEKREQFVSYAFFLQQLGAFFGISAYTVLSLRMGRRPAFAIFFALAFVVVSYTFLFADTIVEAYVLAPIVGFVTLGPFGGYAIYFPELFPTRLRSTGVGFCYNVGRFLAALLNPIKSSLKGLFMAGTLTLPLLPSAINNAELAIRYGSFVMIFIYLVGLVVVLFAPETKDQPLPED
ncbi:MAG TPA: MFS transporter [Phycisphaerae bacterium]|nr:MFS transporter [Phycisphaerae bacterium]HOJ73718.1 MFS transporter [Phycisphaerae bacterium]HOM50365.1 MFS transporter [Phycisphaerae bacterium]HON67195.1 MFS transporter [Phycisphaerae bacterium]HOQ84223.1 MFS transporter [Phycisphaerae bacterium]